MKPRPPFIDLRPAEVEVPAIGNGLFLGRLDPATVRHELEEAGILAGLAARGYREVLLRASIEAGEHRLCILSGDARALLVDLRLAEASALLKEPGLFRLGLELLSFLSMRWLSLQDPGAAFTRERPRLPGQRYPGLGLSRRFYERLLLWAEEWGKDGLVNHPQYFHNAVFYHRAFRFISPAREGRFEAIARDLGALPVAEASAALEEGRVEEEGAGSAAWEPGEMVSPLTRGMRGYLDSPDYARAVEAVRERTRFRVVP
jgi:hypothetical protein